MQIILGNCLDKLKELEDNSVDSIVTDPPYELGFMGKSWDNTGIANNKEMWAECLRVLKPGGHLLAFSGTRTYHRMASAIEDAGFEVRDMIEWVYGSGFPKSLNIGKSVDKLQGNKREVIGVSEGKGYSSIQEKNIEQDNRPYVDGLPYLKADRTLTKGTSEWEGWGTALKPAHEPICMARKPLAEKTVAENVLKYGTGGINIDESRVGLQEGEKKIGGFGNEKIGFQDQSTDLKRNVEWKESTQARFPANLIHDNSEEVRECFPETKSNGKYNKTGDWENTGDGEIRTWDIGYDKLNKYAGQEGNASRFFKSIITDKLCTLCCLPFDIKHDTMSVCKNTNVSSAEKSLKITQATTEAIAPQNATMPDNKKFVQSVKSVANLCDLCGTYIAHVLVEGKPVHQEESALGRVFITEQKKKILDNVLASFVELRGKKDTTPTMNDLNLLFGFVFSAIENSTTYSDKESEAEKNHEWKSLLYQAKASKSERNKGCEGLEEKEKVFNGQSNIPSKEMKDVEKRFTTLPQANNHPTVKPIALMEYLIKMVTPKGGIVLDPFMGSGSTGVAAKHSGFDFIGIEMEEEYIKIAEARINAVTPTLL